MPAAMPHTGRAADGSPRGVAVAVARLVAESLGRPLELHWCATAACSWKCLGEKSCDVVIGHPHRSGPAGGVAWTTPYGGSHFGLVVPRASRGAGSLADLVGKRVGIVAGTVAVSEKDHKVRRFKSREALLDWAASDVLDAAFLEADFAAWYLHTHPKLGLRLVTDYVPHQRWNMAMAVRSGDRKLLGQIDGALRRISSSGRLRKAYTDRGMVYRAPFTNIRRQAVTYNTWKRIGHRGALTVRMDPSNLPYSSANKAQPGFDVKLARAVAEELGVKLHIGWLDVRHQSAVGALLEDECDLTFGAAVDPAAVDDDEELAGKIIYSRPYYGTGYFLVERKAGPHVRSLDELKGKKSRRLGTEAGSVADYRLRQRGYQRRLFGTQLAVLNALDGGAIDHAYLWANAGWTLHTTPEFGLRLVPDYTPIPEDRWNIAVAMRRGDEELKRQVDVALEKLVKNGTVSRVMARYHVPYLPVFVAGRASTEKAPADAIARRPTDEPATKRQRSRAQYNGLDRVRSSGQLVVGLDHRNLPLSTVHPEPAGLDYEIAHLLADKFGVSLSVYWAYSSHGSYPSKLARKKLCDVILGVTPDERFSGRVLFSKPYYMASYQLAVRAGTGAPADFGESVAVEPGIAVRRFSGSSLKYPSLDAVLEAVAAGEARAGYVISTRGHWLAQRRWPGQFKFLDSPAPVDRFPICAALRKNERDLKAAVDRAFDELAQSGRMAEVFARWHIPYTAPNEKDEPPE